MREQKKKKKDGLTEKLVAFHNIFVKIIVCRLV